MTVQENVGGGERDGGSRRGRRRESKEKELDVRKRNRGKEEGKEYKER